MAKLDPISPGEILKCEFMEPHKLSGNQLARALGIPTNRITDILRGRRSITADTALRLERYFGMEAQFWLNLQTNYDLRMTQRNLGAQIKSEVRPRKAA